MLSSFFKDRLKMFLTYNSALKFSSTISSHTIINKIALVIYHFKDVDLTFEFLRISRGIQICMTTKVLLSDAYSATRSWAILAGVA